MVENKEDKDKYFLSLSFEHGKMYIPKGAVKGQNIDKVLGVSPPNRSKTLIRNFSPVQELGIKDFLAVFS